MAPLLCSTAHQRMSLSRGLRVLILCALAVASSQLLVTHGFTTPGLVRFSYRYGVALPSMQQQGNSNSLNAAIAAGTAAAAATTRATPSAASIVVTETVAAAPPRAYIRGAAVAAGRVGQTPGETSGACDSQNKSSSALFSESPGAAGAGGSELLERIKDVVSDQLKVDRGKVHLESNFIKDLNADSLDSVELVMAFEEKFGVTIPDEAATKIATVQDALSYITNALGSSSKEGGSSGSTVEKA